MTIDDYSGVIRTNALQDPVSVKIGSLEVKFYLTKYPNNMNLLWHQHDFSNLIMSISFLISKKKQNKKNKKYPQKHVKSQF